LDCEQSQPRVALHQREFEMSPTMAMPELPVRDFFRTTVSNELSLAPKAAVFAPPLSF
jgi:hypothetical protein